MTADGSVRSVGRDSFEVEVAGAGRSHVLEVPMTSLRREDLGCLRAGVSFLWEAGLVRLLGTPVPRPETDWGGHYA